MDQQTSTNQRGYIVMYSVVIIGAIVMSMVLAGSWVFLNILKSNRLILAMQQSRASADACAETALQTIRDNSNYSGTGIVTLGSDQCMYTVINQGGENRLIQAQATVSGSISKIEVIVSGIDPEILVDSWLPVSDF